jgi:hypothetical protein
MRGGGMKQPKQSEFFHFDTKPTTDETTIQWLRSENAYLRGVISAYEKVLKLIGYIKEEE